MHPDLNPGNKKVEQEFKEVNVAYDLLSDPKKRERFDRGEIDASGAERPERSFYRAYAEGGLFQLTMHPHVIGHRSRIAVLEELLDHISGHADVWYATHADIARYVLRNGSAD